MARPRTFSDEDLLDAAQRVLLEKGPQVFTLTDAADAAGISRPALIQRFGNREALLRAMAAREVELTRDWLAGFPEGRGRAATWAFLVEIVGAMGDGHGAASRAGMAALEALDPELQAHGATRYRLVQEAIAERLPGDAPAGMAEILHAIIAGATMQWIVLPEGPLSSFVLQRLRDHLSVLWPRQVFSLPA